MKRNHAIRSTTALVFGWCGIRMFVIFGATVEEEDAREIAAPTALEGPLDESEALPKFAALAQTAILVKRAATPQELRHVALSPHQQLIGSSVTQMPKRNVDTVPQATDGAGPFEANQKIAALPPAVEADQTSIQLTQLPATTQSRPDFSGSSWVVYRPNSALAPLADVGQLGGSQLGSQLILPVAQIPKFASIALQTRLSRALQTPGQAEAGLGIRFTLHPKIPITVRIERRIRLSEGGRNAFAVGVASGFDDKPLPKGVLVSGYGQAGVVGLKAHDLYVDGAIRAERRLFTSANSEVRVGVAVWGAAQPGVSRADIGPRISGSFRIGGARLQASAEWRQRLAGGALPNSGPALTMGTDF